MAGRTATLLLVAFIANVAAAQSPSPYAGEEVRVLKALSAQEITAYREGRGMGLAKAAELNHYPGPRHVLDLATELELSDDQLTRSQAVFEAMKARAMALGEQIVTREAELDQRFADQEIDAALLDAMLASIGALQAQLRHAHLNAHLQQRAILSDDQIRRYDLLRGYGVDAKHEHRHEGH